MPFLGSTIIAMTNESTITLIQKLKAKAESCAELGNEAEAQAFMAKVHKLLDKHRLAISDIESYVTGDTVIEDIRTYYQRSDNCDWRRFLGAILAEHNYCQSIFSRHYKRITFIGSPQDVEVTSYMFDFASLRFRALAKQAFKAHIVEARNKANVELESMGLKPEKFTTKELFYLGRIYSHAVFYREFLMSAMRALNTKLTEERAKMSESDQSKCRAITIVADAAVNDYMTKEYPDIKTAKASRRATQYSPEARAAGREAAKNFDFNKGISNGPRKEIVKKLG